MSTIMTIQERAARVWAHHRRELPLDTAALLDAVEEHEAARDVVVGLLGRDVVDSSERGRRATAMALLPLGILGPGTVLSGTDRAEWVVPDDVTDVWDAVVRRVTTWQTRTGVEDLLRSQTRPGYIRPTVLVGHAATGRSHVEAPRMQGLSSEQVARFVAVPLVTVDQSRAEPTILAHLSGDAQLADDLDGDPYQVLADDLGVTRAIAKRAFMSIPYGTGVGRLESTLGVTRREAETIVEGWRSRYADAWAWCRQQVTNVEAAGGGSVELYDGTQLEVEASYQAPAFICQGTGALLTHEWTVRAANAARRGELSGAPAWPVHDALVWEVEEDAADEAADLLIDLLGELTIPLTGERG